MLSRKKEITQYLVLFFVFSLASLLLLLTLFHIAILGFPIVGFMWTFFWYRVFQAITLIRIKTRYKVETAALVLVYGYVAISLLLLGAFFEDADSGPRAVAIAVIGTVFLLCVFFTVLLIRKLIKEYWPSVKGLVRRKPGLPDAGSSGPSGESPSP